MGQSTVIQQRTRAKIVHDTYYRVESVNNLRFVGFSFKPMKHSVKRHFISSRRFTPVFLKGGTTMPRVSNCGRMHLLSDVKRGPEISTLSRLWTNWKAERASAHLLVSCYQYPHFLLCCSFRGTMSIKEVDFSYFRIFYSSKLQDDFFSLSVLAVNKSPK